MRRPGSATSSPCAATPPGDPLGEWVAHPEGLTYADELVRLVRRLGDFCVGVAAFPYGHPRSADTDADTARLLAKIRAGADFAITQLFLEPEGFLRLRDRLAALGCDIPLLPGIMPVLSVRTLRRGPELSGAPVPRAVLERLEPFADDPVAFRVGGPGRHRGAVRPAAGRRRAGAALLHAEPLDGDRRAGAPPGADLVGGAPGLTRVERLTGRSDSAPETRTARGRRGAGSVTVARGRVRGAAGPGGCACGGPTAPRRRRRG